MKAIKPGQHITALEPLPAAHLAADSAQLDQPDPIPDCLPAVETMKVTAEGNQPGLAVKVLPEASLAEVSIETMRNESEKDRMSSIMLVEVAVKLEENSGVGGDGKAI